MKKYRVKVTEIHSDYVWIEANSREEAIETAPANSDCMFECLYESRVVSEEDAKQP